MWVSEVKQGDSEFLLRVAPHDTQNGVAECDYLIIAHGEKFS